MARYSTAEETRTEYIRLLGEDMGSIYYRLFNECGWLHVTWDQYTQLFGESEERVTLLNEAAPLFFRVVQDTLWHSLLLHLSALTDPATTGNKSNLTVRRLVDVPIDAEGRLILQKAIDEAVESTGFARDWRNRRIAHLDLPLAVSEGAKPLAPASRKDVQDAIGKVCEVVRLVSVHCFDTDLVLGGFPEPYGATSLLYVIRDGLKAERDKRERLQSGEPYREDLDPPAPL